MVEEEIISFADLKIRSPESGSFELNKNSLNKYLQSLFLLRETLKEVWGENSEDLIAFDNVLSSALMIFVSRSGISKLLEEAQVQGWVDNGVDVLPIIEPRLKDFYEDEKLLSKEDFLKIPIIGVVGKIASGKGFVAQALGGEFRVMSFPFSDRLREASFIMGLYPPYQRGKLREVNDLYKPAFGKEIFVEQTMKLLERRFRAFSDVPDFIIVDGFRSVEEAKFFLTLGNTSLIAIVASEDEKKDREIRFKRQKRRRRGKEDSLNMEEFLKDDELESDWIQPVIDLVVEEGEIIVNDGSLEDLSDKIKAALGLE